MVHMRARAGLVTIEVWCRHRRQRNDDGIRKQCSIPYLSLWLHILHHNYIVGVRVCVMVSGPWPPRDKECVSVCARSCYIFHVAIIIIIADVAEREHITMGDIVEMFPRDSSVQCSNAILCMYVCTSTYVA